MPSSSSTLFHRYFTTGSSTPPLGGAPPCYPLLTHNARIFETHRRSPSGLSGSNGFWKPTPASSHGHIPSSTLFAYFAGMPKKSVLGDAEGRWRWREGGRRSVSDLAREVGVVASTTTVVRFPLPCVSWRKERAAVAQAQGQVAALEAELQAMRSGASSTRRPPGSPTRSWSAASGETARWPGSSDGSEARAGPERRSEHAEIAERVADPARIGLRRECRQLSRRCALNCEEPSGSAEVRSRGPRILDRENVVSLPSVRTTSRAHPVRRPPGCTRSSPPRSA